MSTYYNQTAAHWSDTVYVSVWIHAWPVYSSAWILVGRFRLLAGTEVLLGINHSAAHVAVSRRYELPRYTSNMEL